MAVNERAKELLHDARTAIRSEPRSYAQHGWGDAAPSCESPCCVAGHIVAAKTKRTKLNQEKTEEAASRTQSWLQSRHADAKAYATKQDPGLTSDAANVRAARHGTGFAATHALGLEEVPRLFDATWPPAWIEETTKRPADKARMFAGKISPNAEEAAAVLLAIIKGGLPDALYASTIY